MNKDKINNAEYCKNKTNYRKYQKHYLFKWETGNNTIYFITFKINYYMFDKSKTV